MAALAVLPYYHSTNQRIVRLTLGLLKHLISFAHIWVLVFRVCKTPLSVDFGFYM